MDYTVKKIVDILCVVLVRVSSFIFSLDFEILDFEVYFEIPIML